MENCVGIIENLQRRNDPFRRGGFFGRGLKREVGLLFRWILKNIGGCATIVV